MKNYGFIRVASVVPSVKVANVKYNTEMMKQQLEIAIEKGVSLVAFPELCVTSSTCGDLFSQELLIKMAENAISSIVEISKKEDITIVAGAPVRCRGRLYDCAVVIKDGTVKGIVPKIYLSLTDSRNFSSGRDFLTYENSGKCIEYAGCETYISPNQIFHIGDTSFAVELGEDLSAAIPPSSFHSMAGAEIIVNISAESEVLTKDIYKKKLIQAQSSRCCCSYIYCSSGYGESTQDGVYAGTAMIYENGNILSENKRYETESNMIIADVDYERIKALRHKELTKETVCPNGEGSLSYSKSYKNIQLGAEASTDFEKTFYREVEAHPFVPGVNEAEIDRRCKEITSMQIVALASRLRHINCKTAIIGISGGLDSTLALLVTALAFDNLGWSRDRIIGITMPGLGTTERTRNNAVDLMDALGVCSREISIVDAVKQHFKDIGQDMDKHDVTYENSQARERTQILMDISNKENGIVVGTGDLSELALGWATYNGDHMSMYNVNGGIPKTLVKYLVKWAALNRFDEKASSGRSVKDILLDIVDTPISPELTPADDKGNIAQKTEDLVGPYELHDFYLYNFFRFGYSPSKLFFLAKKAFIYNKSTNSIFIGPEGKANEYTEEILLKWLKKFYWRFFSQQFKRSCMPEGPKIGSVSLSSREDWRMPSDSSAEMWVAELD